MATSDQTPQSPYGLRSKTIDVDRRLIRQCVHCGLCLDACPTYRVLGNELDSPRGRIYQIKALADGRISADDPNFREHIYRCLDCRACETACPSGVDYGRLVEAARAEISAVSPSEKVARASLLNTVFTSPTLLDAMGVATRVYQKSGLQTAVRGSGVLGVLPGPFARLGEMEAMLPVLQGGLVKRHIPEIVPAIGPRQARVAFLTGCVAHQFFGETNQNTVRVLARNGCEVVTPRDQRCCGALHVHSGERDTAIDLAKQNVAAFEQTGADYYVINAAGCGSTLKEYHELLEHDPDPAWHERGRAFVTKMRDINELLVELGGLTGALGEVPVRATYQDACHLAHGQGIREQPRQLLLQIPGLDLVEMPNADWCCGSAGIYNVTHPDMAHTLLQQKMDLVMTTGAAMLIASNPGCIIQLAAGVRERGVPMEVIHPIDLIEKSYALADGNGRPRS